jgi:hypothetical protein
MSSAAERVPAPVCEPLEARQLFAADLLAFELLGRLPQDLISGAKARVHGLAVNVRNAGNAEVRNDVITRLYASADSTLDPLTDPLIMEQQTRLRLQPGRQRHIPLRLREVPAGIARGAYQLFAFVDATNVVAGEDNEGNNSVGSTTTVNIGPPFVNLAVSDLFVGKDQAATQGRRARVALTVLNQGNITAKGNAGIQLVFTPVGGGAAAAPIDVPVRVNLRSGRERALRGSFAIPAGLAPGQYSVTATLTSIVGFTDENPADNSDTETITIRQR